MKYPLKLTNRFILFILGKTKAVIYESYDIGNSKKALIYLCDLQRQILPYADVWVTAFLTPNLQVIGDETSKKLFELGKLYT